MNAIIINCLEKIKAKKREWGISLLLLLLLFTRLALLIHLRGCHQQEWMGLEKM